MNEIGTEGSSCLAIGTIIANDVRMKVSALLQNKGSRVEIIRGESSVMMAVHRMRLEGIGSLVVSADERSVEGVVTERDIIRGLAEYGSELLSKHVHEIMSPADVTCTPDDSVKHLMSVMTLRRRRHIPVLEGDRLVGLVSIGDIVKHRLGEVELEADVLRDAYLAK